jgi:hypothetical protein
MLRKRAHSKHGSGSFFLEVYITQDVMISAFHIPRSPANRSFTMTKGQEGSLSNQFVEKFNSKSDNVPRTIHLCDCPHNQIQYTNYLIFSFTNVKSQTERLLEGGKQLACLLGLLFNFQNAGSMSLTNVRKLLPDYTV